MILFSIGYIVLFSITMIVTFYIKDDYPELLTTVTFAYFSIEIVVSAGIKIFEVFSVKRKKKEKTEDGYIPEKADENSEPEERETDYNEHT